MAQQKKGLITRMLEGKERSEEYARSTLPTNRWQLFWDIFKGNFWKIAKVNLLILVFFIPLLIVLIFQGLMLDSYGASEPFGGNLGIGYPMAPELYGHAESLTLTTNLTTNIGLVITSFIAAVGLSGGMYVVRNMVWTEGVFVTNDFWRGVKLNFKNALQTALFFTLIFFVCQLLINMSDYVMAVGLESMSNGQLTWLRISQGVSYVFMTVAALMSLWMIALGVNYKMNFVVMVKNSFLMMLGTLPQTVFFGVIAVLPFLIVAFGGSMLTAFGVIAVAVFGFAYALLVWLDFAQWVFDKYINPKLEGAKVGRGIYNRDGSAQLTGDDSAATIEYQRMILAHGRSRLVARPIKPIDDSLQVYELPQAFTREDLQKLRESKQNIAEDSEAYAEEHKNDLRYVEYNKQFDERERAVQEEDAKGKKKRAKKPPKILEE